MNPYTTLRLKRTTWQVLHDISQVDGTSMQEVLDRAIEDLRRKRFLEQVNADYAALRADPGAWAEEQAERKAWEATLADSLPAGGTGVVREPAAARKRRRKRS